MKSDTNSMLLTVALLAQWTCAAAAGDDGAERKLGRALGELTQAGHCPKVEINASSRTAAFSSLKLDPNAPTPAFEAGVIDGQSRAIQIVSEKGAAALCQALTERYGPTGSEAKDLVLLKP